MTGYVATHIVKLLLERLPSTYKIKATVRNRAKLDTLAPFKEIVGEESFNRIELVDMDLSKPESIINALEGVTHLIHVASPLNPADNPTYDDYVNPVKIGTKAVIEGIKKHHVKKVVVTGTLLNVMSNQHKGDGAEYDENDYSEVKNLEGY